MLTHSNQLIGLILAAGKSSRMKVDKAFINYHDKPQFEYAANQLLPFVDNVIISGKENTTYGIFEVVLDQQEFENNGPIGGLLSAMKFYPNCSFFLLGCDYPYLSNESLKILKDNFLKSNKSVCFMNNTNGYLEPLVAIYNSEDLKKLYHFWQSKQTSLRHFLEFINPLILPTPHINDILSIDTPKNI
jgi:molybdopterin-guanine dinucleotide biosynthesis protein A